MGKISPISLFAPLSARSKGGIRNRRRSSLACGPITKALPGKQVAFRFPPLVASPFPLACPVASPGPTCGVAAPVAAPRRLHVRASDQGFLPIQVDHYVMLLDWTGAGTPRGQARGDSRALGPNRGAAGPQSIELGGNGARLRSAVQAGGGAIELACRCRGTLLEALVPGQSGGSNRLCVGHWLDGEP